MEGVNPKDVTVLWHGWLKKLGRFSKRWRKRYFVFLSTANGMKELRHYDTQREVSVLLATTPKGVLAMTDATGICCFLPPSPSALGAKKHTMFNRTDASDASNSDAYDQKFAVLTPLHVHMLAFNNGKEWASASESQQGLSLLASLSAFYPAVEVLHSGYMSKKRERTVHTAAKSSMISYWKRHFFAFLSSGDLLYFRDETLSEYQGRVDVRHAPTVRVTGERMLEEKKRELGALLLKFAKFPGTATQERESCLVWIATPPSKMFVIKVQDDNEGVTTDGKRQELTASAKKWLTLLLQGHAETKYTQLEQCISIGKFDTTPEIVSAVRTGIPDELRGALWKGFSGATDLQRRCQVKRNVRKISKTNASRNVAAADASTERNLTEPNFFDELSAPINSAQLHTPENKMIFARLCAIAMHDHQFHAPSNAEHRPREKSEDDGNESSSILVSQDESEKTDIDDSYSDSEAPSPTTRSQSLKQVAKSKLGHYLYPSESNAAEWEVLARRRLLIAHSRFNPYSHPFPWKVLCLLLAYLDEESAFWVINSVQDTYLPGYYHGYRPALQVDAAVFTSLLAERTPALVSHLKSLAFPVERTMERWFLSLFTSTHIPLPTVLRIWDGFFAQGVRVFFGIGIAIFLRAEDKLFQARSTAQIFSILDATERGCIDADALFSHVFKDDLNISWLPEERFNRSRSQHRQRVIETVSQQLELFKDKLIILSQLKEHTARALSTVRHLLSSSIKRDGAGEALKPPSATLDWTHKLFEIESDDVDDDDSAQFSLIALQSCLRSFTDAINKFASDLNSRQARWLALSSQLAGYPVSRGTVRLTTDLQSWILQVREGKISGAGLDTLPDDRHSNASNSLEIFPSSVDAYEMFFEADAVNPDGSITRPKWSCLITEKDDFSPDDHFVTEGFMLSLATTLKAACAARLECLGHAHRYAWQGGSWLESCVEFPDTNKPENPSPVGRSSSRTLRRAASNVSKTTAIPASSWHRNPRLFSDATEVQNTRNSLDDSVLYRRQVNETVQDMLVARQPRSDDQRRHNPLDNTISGGMLSSTFVGSATYLQRDSWFYSSAQSPTAGVNTPSVSSSALNYAVSGSTQMQLQSKSFKQAEEVLHATVDSIMSCFSRFIRLESRRQFLRKWELRERALLLEEDLVQELKSVEAISNQVKTLY